MGPDPTGPEHTFPAVNKRPTRLWPRYFLIRPYEIFLTQSAKNWKIWLFKVNFPMHKPKQRWLTQPKSKIFDPDLLLPVSMAVYLLFLLFLENNHLNIILLSIINLAYPTQTLPVPTLPLPQYPFFCVNPLGALIGNYIPFQIKNS